MLIINNKKIQVFIFKYYREIGKTLHDLGAYRAVLLHSKPTPNEKYRLNLEIAVDGAIDIAQAKDICMKKWDDIHIELIDMNDYKNIHVMQEVIEDGIQI